MGDHFLPWNSAPFDTLRYPSTGSGCTQDAEFQGSELLFNHQYLFNSTLSLPRPCFDSAIAQLSLNLCSGSDQALSPSFR
jgi:hypothetical protein